MQREIFMRRVTALATILLSAVALPVGAQGWRDNTALLVYSPRYFGPNAFPMPDLHGGRVGSRIEAEVRGEYHYYTGDRTSNLSGRFFYPFVKGRAGAEISFIYKENYTLTPETRDERHAADTQSPVAYEGDIVISSFFQLLEGHRALPDAVVRFSLKTASGDRLCDARFTDAAAYWIDLAFGKDLVKSAGNNFLRIQAMLGFYCWMTNDVAHRQNDAALFGGGLTGRYRRFTLSSDLSGIYGYENNGDRPLIFRNKLAFETRNNILSACYHHGMKDRLYDTYSLSYTRCFH
ncbi:hypothetical protein Barb6XT_03059 [Bacteroidales bacterium Barb6XT]|nr:hypothetical protein Barb6XT_03059 [Bacteroidales bacterium Barb6XT]